MSVRRVRDLKFVNAFPKELVGDSMTFGEAAVRVNRRLPASQTPRQVLGAHYSFVLPEPCPAPKLLGMSKGAADLIDWSGDVANDTGNEWIEFLSGNLVPETTNPWALAYGGHQFGSWAGQLGDGRAITLGQIINTRGDPWEIQLKGAGLTPYSRFADGYAVVRSSIREFLCSETMAALGIPTSRAMSVIASSRDVARERMEKGAIVCRLAPTWIRFGNFELFFSRGDLDNLRLLADFTIKHHFSQVSSSDEPDAKGAAIELSFPTALYKKKIDNKALYLRDRKMFDSQTILTSKTQLGVIWFVFLFCSIALHILIHRCWCHRLAATLPRKKLSKKQINQINIIETWWGCAVCAS